MNDNTVILSDSEKRAGITPEEKQREIEALKSIEQLHTTVISHYGKDNHVKE